MHWHRMDKAGTQSEFVNAVNHATSIVASSYMDDGINGRTKKRVNGIPWDVGRESERFDAGGQILGAIRMQ